MTDILVWNDDYGMLPDQADGCSAEVRLVRDRARLAEADAVIFHIPSLFDPIDRLPKRPGQRWVAWSMESDSNYPVLTDPAFMRQFDLTMTYRRDADVWVPYLPSELFLPLGPASSGTPGALASATAVYIASNPRCPSGRDAYVADLQRHMAVDCFGSCLNNRTWATDHGRATKLGTIAQYPFTLAFENSISDDYVTEKFFDAFLAGSVPVYLGAANVADLAPGAHSYIDVRSFGGPRELAAHLLALAADETAYREYHAWRAEGPRPAFRTLAEPLTSHPLCRLARLLTAGAP